MKSRMIYLLVFCLSQSALAQITGKVVTAAGEPVPFANVLLLKASDTAVLKTTFTDHAGSYLFPAPERGKYLLRVSSMGYESWESPLFEIAGPREQKELGTSLLKVVATQLGAVTVQASKPLYQQQADGIVVNVENSIMTKGSTVLALLERSPGVAFDYRNNSISLNGKSGVAVMLNGRLLRLPLDQVVSLLNGMSGNDVEKIALLTMPGASYDAEGSAGVINIITKRSHKPGRNGTLSLSGGYGKGEKGSSSIRLAGNTANTSLDGSYSFSHDRTYSDMFIDSDQDMPALGGQMNVLVWDTSKVVRNTHDVSLGIERNIRPGVKLGGSLSFNSSIASSVTTNRSRYLVLPDSLLRYNGSVHSTNRWRNVMSSIYLDKEIREGEKINIDLDYLGFRNSSPSAVQSIFLNKDDAAAGADDPLFSPQQQGFANTTINVGVVKVDYAKPLNEKFLLAVGLKGSYTRSSSTSGIQSLINHEWVDRTETFENVLMKEAIGAAYSTVTASLHPTVTVTLGLRYEYAYTHMINPVTRTNTLERRQGVLFPEATISKKLGESASLQLSYSKRISRPAYNDLASYVIYSDPTAVYTGNPFLQSTITNNIKIGYNYKGYTFSLLFSRDDHPIARYQLTEKAAGNLLYVSPQNLQYQNYITLQANLPWKVTEWWSMNYNLTGGLRQFKLDYTRKPLDKAYLAYILSATESFTLPKNYAIELSGWYNSLSYGGSSRRLGGDKSWRQKRAAA